MSHVHKTQVQIHVRLPTDLHDDVKELAQLRGWPVTIWVREALKQQAKYEHKRMEKELDK